MLEKSDISVAETLLLFNDFGLDVGLLVPTETAMEKSIIDAHGTFRAYLERKQIHDFSKQKQGDKTLLPATFIGGSNSKETKISLYRPNTKDGDPRIWVYDLKKYASAYNLIGFIFLEGKHYIVNCSNRKSLDNLFSKNGPLSRLYSRIPHNIDYIASGLLNKLKAISARGYIPSKIPGDTGVGMTLEAELGIAANSVAEPDYNGIELKTSRKKQRGTKNRVTLFSKAPNWKISPVGKAINLLNLRGYDDKDGRFSLYHTLNGKKTNSLGLKLEVDYKSDTLKQIHIDGQTITHDTSWQLPALRESLQTKHPATFWIKAEAKIINGIEHFHYTEVTYTQSPRTQYLEMLIEDGVITLDYAMHRRSSGNAVRDHGYLFKILPANFNALFPKPINYNLLE